MTDRLPALAPADVIRALERAGFAVRRTRGSHHVLVHASQPHRRVVVPMHAKDIKRGLLHRIIKDAGLSIDQFLALL